MRMWLVRFKIRLVLPRARAMIRLSVGPSPTIASFTTNPSGFKFALFSALAIALLSVLIYILISLPYDFVMTSKGSKGYSGNVLPF